VVNIGYKHDSIQLKELGFWRLIFSLSVTKPVNMTHCKWRYSYFSTLHIFFSSDYGFKHNLLQINIFV